MSGHDTHFAGFRNDTGTVSTNHSRFALRFQGVIHSDLVPLRDTFGDGDNQLDLVLDGFNDSIGSSRRWNVNDGSIGFGMLDSVGNRAEDGSGEMLSSGFLQ